MLFDSNYLFKLEANKVKMKNKVKPLLPALFFKFSYLKTTNKNTKAKIGQRSITSKGIYARRLVLYSRVGYSIRHQSRASCASPIILIILSFACASGSYA